MAKAKFERTKPHVNVGTIGHVEWKDHFDCSNYQGFGISRYRKRRS